MSTSAQPANPTCPRCSYDQSGAVAAWTDSCPIRGTCPECGLTFDWRDVFHPYRDRVRGFVEHTRGFSSSLWAVPPTAWLVARPWKFWERVQMHMRPRLGRAVLAVCLILVTVWFAKGAIGMPWLVAEAIYRQQGTFRGYVNWGLDDAAIDMWGRPLFHSNGWTSGAGGALHLYWAPAEWLIVFVPLLISTPLWLFGFTLLPDSLRACRIRPAHLNRAFMYSWSWLAIPLLPWLVQSAMLALHGMDRVRNRWEPLFGGMNMDFPETLSAHPIVPALLVVFAYTWLSLWWLCAIRSGFKLSHAWGVWLALLVLNALGTVAIGLCALILILGPLGLGGPG